MSILFSGKQEHTANKQPRITKLEQGDVVSDTCQRQRRRSFDSPRDEACVDSVHYKDIDDGASSINAVQISR